MSLKKITAAPAAIAPGWTLPIAASLWAPMQCDLPDFLLHLLCNHLVVAIQVPESNTHFFPNFGKMLFISFRLLSTRNASVQVGKHPAGSYCSEGWSLLLNYCAFFFLVQKAENAQLPMISEEAFRWKPVYFPGIQPDCFNQGIFMPCQLLGFPQKNVIGLTQWPKKTKTCFKLHKFSPCRGDSDRGEQHKALQQPPWNLQGRRRGRLCLWWAMMPSRANSHHHLLKAAYSPKQALYSGKSCCSDLYGSWKLILISSSFLMCLKVSKWWNICIYIREDTGMALLWVHPCILLHIAGDRFEREEWVLVPLFLWYLPEYITDPNWKHYIKMPTDLGCFMGP